MAVQRAATASGRWQPRFVIRLFMMVAVAVLLCLSTFGVWGAVTDGVDRTASERDGVEYLRPLSKLTVELVDAQSAAVRGGAVKAGEVTTAVDAVADADQAVGADLGVHKAWTDAKKAILDVVAAKPVGPAAFDRYSEVVGMVRRLTIQVAERSNLLLDPDAAPSYLVDTAVNQLTRVVVSSGLAADLSVLVPGGAAADDPAVTRMLIARYDVATAADAIGTGLTNALDASDSRTIGASITGQLDGFRSAVDEFVPSGTRLRTLEVADAANLPRTAVEVREAARPLADAVLKELDRLLEDRAGSLRQRWLLSIGGLVLSLLMVLAVLVLALRPERRTVTVPVLGSPTDPAAARGPRAGPDTSIIDPRDMRAMEQMLTAGRQTARAGLRERGNDVG